MSFTICGAGDIIMSGSRIGSGPEGDAVFAELRAADTSFVNLEMPLTNADAGTDKPICLKAPPALASELKSLGIDIVTLANNHAMDFGERGLRETTETLAAAGIHAVGAAGSLAESLRPAQLLAGGARVAYFGIATTLPNGSNAGHNRPGVAPIRVMTSFAIDAVSIQESPGMAPFVETYAFEGDVAIVLEAVRKAAAENDLVIVAMHWGVPYGWVAASQDEIAQYQTPLGHALVDAGASAIIGHHPHVVQGVEFYKGRPIFYSLGNLVMHNVLAAGVLRAHPKYSFDSLQSRLSRIGAIARLTWSDIRQPPACVLIPINLNADGEPEFTDRTQSEEAFARLAHHGRRLGSRVELEFHDGRAEIRVAPVSA